MEKYIYMTQGIFNINNPPNGSIILKYDSDSRTFSILDIINHVQIQPGNSGMISGCVSKSQFNTTVDQLKNQMSGYFEYKGHVDSVDDLPIAQQKIQGDFYTVADQEEYVCVYDKNTLSASWVPFGFNISIQKKADIDYVNSQLSGKVDKSSIPTLSSAVENKIHNFTYSNFLTNVNPSGTGVFTFNGNGNFIGHVDATDYKLKDNNINLYYNGAAVSATYKPIFVTQLTSSNITFGTSLTSTNKNYISTTWLSNLTYDQEGTQPVQNRFYINVGMNYPCSAWNSVVIGTKNTINAGAHLSLVNGYQNTANGIASHAEGEDTQSFGQGSHAEGYYSITSGGWSHTQGRSTTTKGDYSHAEGYLTVTSLSGIYSHAEGQETITSGQCSHAQGILTKAVGNYSHTEGQKTISNGPCSHAEGRQTITSGNYSHAEGYLTKTNNDYSHAEGYNTQTNNTYSHAEGFGSTANGTYSHAEGKETKTEKEGSHAQGILTKAIGPQSHAEGNSTIAKGSYSHAEGVETEANGGYSHSEGEKTFANYTASHTEGYQTKSSQDYQHVEGKWNIPSAGFQKIVGGGSSESDRKNIYMLDWNGNELLCGSVTASDFITKDQNHKLSNKADKATTLSGYGIINAYTKSEVNSELNKKQDLINSSNKLSYDLLSGTPTIPTALSSLTQDEDHRLVTGLQKQTWNEKADKTTTLSGYGIINAYTKLEVDNILGQKVDKVDGKQLISSTLITKLQSLENYDDSQVRTLINKVNFGTIMSNVQPYDGYGKPFTTLDVDLMIKPGMYYLNTGWAQFINYPAGITEGCVLVLDNGQIFIEGNYGRTYYRHQDPTTYPQEGKPQIIAYKQGNTLTGATLPWQASALSGDIPTKVSQLANDIPYLSSTCLSFPDDVIKYAYYDDPPTSGTTKNFCYNFCELGYAKAGMMYLGQLKLNDLPWEGNAECIVQIPEDDIMELQLFSTDIKPHKWTAMYRHGYDNGMIDVDPMAVSPWKGVLSCPVTEQSYSPVYTPLSDYDATTKKYVDDSISGKVTFKLVSQLPTTLEENTLYGIPEE